MSDANESVESEPTDEPDRAHRRRNASDDGWELWTKVAVGLTVVSAVAWALVWARLGSPSVRIHAFVIPILGTLTLPVVFWGGIRTTFNPPLVRSPRVIGFGLLLTVAFFGNVPMVAVPLSTEGWESGHTYRLPFDGAWDTLAGGQRVARNYHATTAAYRWGYDFAPRRDGSRFAGDGETLEDYYCWGAQALAPAGGEVVRAEDGHKDFEPRDFDETSVLGNHVVVEVDEGEYLFVAQLKKESISVEAGEHIERGTVIGECGNSGRAVEPHVHVHLQTTPDFPLDKGLSFGAPMAEGLPLRFSNYRADGEFVERGMPKGQGDGGEPAGQVVEHVGQRDR